MVKLEAEKFQGKILVSEGSFEHLLNCLDNQKFIVFDEDQVRIDDFNRQCREFLHDLPDREKLCGPVRT